MLPPHTPLTPNSSSTPSFSRFQSKLLFWGKICLYSCLYNSFISIGSHSSGWHPVLPQAHPFAYNPTPSFYHPKQDLKDLAQFACFSAEAAKHNPGQVSGTRVLPHWNLY